MEIQNVIIHQVIKNRNEKSNLNIREDELAITEPVERLVSDARQTYNKKTGKSYGGFSEDKNNYPFQNFISGYLEGQSSFLEFSKSSLSRLQYTIDRESFATGGYILFIHYIEANNPFIMVLMLKNKVGLAITENLEIKDTIHLDYEKLHFGSRINIKKWQEQKEDYITFIKGIKIGVEVSKYFTEFIGCQEITDTKSATKKLLAAISIYSSNKLLTPAQDKELKHKIFDYCVEKQKEGKPIDLANLSHYVDEENPDDFFQIANSEDIGLSNTFETNRNVLKRLTRYSYRSKRFSIDFSDDMLGSAIEYNRDHGTLTIKDLPDPLKNQLDNR